MVLQHIALLLVVCTSCALATQTPVVNNQFAVDVQVDIKSKVQGHPSPKPTHMRGHFDFINNRIRYDTNDGEFINIMLKDRQFMKGQVSGHQQPGQPEPPKQGICYLHDFKDEDFAQVKQLWSRDAALYAGKETVDGVECHKWDSTKDPKKAPPNTPEGTTDIFYVNAKTGLPHKKVVSNAQMHSVSRYGNFSLGPGHDGIFMIPETVKCVPAPTKEEQQASYEKAQREYYAKQAQQQGHHQNPYAQHHQQGGQHGQNPYGQNPYAQQQGQQQGQHHANPYGSQNPYAHGGQSAHGQNPYAQHHQNPYMQQGGAQGHGSGGHHPSGQGHGHAQGQHPYGAGHPYAQHYGNEHDDEEYEDERYRDEDHYDDEEDHHAPTSYSRHPTDDDDYDSVPARQPRRGRAPPPRRGRNDDDDDDDDDDDAVAARAYAAAAASAGRGGGKKRAAAASKKRKGGKKKKAGKRKGKKGGKKKRGRTQGRAPPVPKHDYNDPYGVPPVDGEMGYDPDGYPYHGGEL